MNQQVYDWDYRVAPRSVGFFRRGHTIAGSPAQSGLREIDEVKAEHWTARLGQVPAAGAIDVKAYRALSAISECGGNLIRVPAFDNEQRPFPLVDGVPISTVGSTEYTDQTRFTDGTGFKELTIKVKLTISHLRGSTEIAATVSNAGPITGGEYFTLGERLHCITEVLTVVGTLQTWRIWPRLRQNYPQNKPLNFDRPTCLMRLASDQADDITIEFGINGVANIEFIEAFEAADTDAFGWDNVPGEIVAPMICVEELTPYVCTAIEFDAPEPNVDSAYNGVGEDQFVIDYPNLEIYNIVEHTGTFGLTIFTQSMDTLDEVRRVVVSLTAGTDLFSTSNAVGILGSEWVLLNTAKSSPDNCNFNSVLNHVSGVHEELADLPIGSFGSLCNLASPKFGMKLGGAPGDFITIWAIDEDFSGATPPLLLSALAIIRHTESTGAITYLMYGDDGPAKTELADVGETFARWTVPGDVEENASTFFVANNQFGAAGKPLPIYKFRVDSAGAITWETVADIKPAIAPGDDTAEHIGGYYDADSNKLIVSWRFGVNDLSDRVYGFSRIDVATGIVEQSISFPKDTELFRFGINWGWGNFNSWSNRNNVPSGYVVLNENTNTNTHWYLLRIDDLTFQKFADKATLSALNINTHAAYIHSECAIYTANACASPSNSKINVCQVVPCP